MTLAEIKEPPHEVSGVGWVQTAYFERGSLEFCQSGSYFAQNSQGESYLAPEFDYGG